MEKMDMLYEGKAKRVYQTENKELYIVDYKDDATAFNGLKKGQIAGKGVVNNRMSNLFFKILAKAGVENHFVEELSDRETLVKKVTIIPLEVIVRNVAAGSFSKRFGVEEGTRLSNPTLEFCLKDDALGDPMINDYHITALNIATKEEIEKLA
ncbi:MAG: phosphoribosylaminoimidazolesuccinocarboxamide synthase, partial [Oscillospiraceae bacterium]